MKKVLLYLICLFGWALVSAQTPLPRSADLLMQQARTAAAEALASYSHQLLDQPLWQEALRSAEEASRLASNHPEPYRFLAESYRTVNWFEPAWRAWDNYLRAGGILDTAASEQIIELGSWLGYNFYNQGNYQQALPYYQRVLELSPSHEQSNVQLGLAYRALGQSEAALPLFETLVQNYPDNPEYRRYLSETRDALQFAPSASQAFYRGLELYHQGLLEQAWLAFDQATKASPNYQDAFIWAGRTALELQQPQDAIPYWQRVVELAPNDETVKYFLRLAENQARWGVATITAFEDGYQHYNINQFDAALVAFQRAVNSNPDFAEAWAWLGRLHFEAEDYTAAQDAFAQANRLEPSSEAYRYFYEESARRLGLEITAETALEPDSNLEDTTGVNSNQTDSPPTSTTTATTLPTTTATTESTVEQGTNESPPATATTQATAVSQPETSQPTSSSETAFSSERVLELLSTQVTFTLAEVMSRSAIAFLAPASSLTINLQQPVDYRGGRLHQRLEVLSKASDSPVTLQLCLVPAADLSTPPACGEQLRINSPDTYSSSQTLSSLSSSSSFTWNQGISSLMLIVRHPDGYTLDAEAASSRGLELSDYFPLRVHVRAMLVPIGTEFPGW